MYSFPYGTRTLENCFALTEQCGLNYCVLCLRSEEERLLIRPYYFLSFAEAIRLKRIWKHNYICKYCEKHAYNAYWFLKAIEVAAAVDSIFQDLMRKKQQQEVRVFRRRHFEQVLAAYNVQDTSAALDFYDEHILKIREATAFGCCETVVLDSTLTSKMEILRTGISVFQIISVTKGQAHWNAPTRESKFRNALIDRARSLNEMAGSSSHDYVPDAETEVTIDSMDAMVIDNQIAYERLTLQDQNPEVTENVTHFADEQTPNKVRRMETQQYDIPAVTITPLEPRSPPTFGRTRKSSVRGNVEKPTPNTSPVKKLIKKRYTDEFQAEKLIRLRLAAQSPQASTSSSPDITLIPPTDYTNRQLSPNSNTSRQLSPNSNTSRQLSPNSNTSRQLSPNSNASRQLSPNSNTSHQLSPNSNTSRQLSPNSYNNRQLSPNSNTSRQLSPNSNTSHQHSPNSYTSYQIPAVAGPSSNPHNKNPILTSLLNDAKRRGLPPMSEFLNNPRRLPGMRSENLRPMHQRGLSMGQTRVYSSPSPSSLNLLRNIIPTFPKPTSHDGNPHNLPGFPSTSQFHPVASTSRQQTSTPVGTNRKQNQKTVSVEEIIKSTLDKSRKEPEDKSGD